MIYHWLFMLRFRYQDLLHHVVAHNGIQKLRDEFLSICVVHIMVILGSTEFCVVYIWNLVFSFVWDRLTFALVITLVYYKQTNEYSNDGDAIIALPSLVSFVIFVLIIAQRVLMYQNERLFNAIVSVQPVRWSEQLSRVAHVIYEGVHDNKWTPIIERRSCYRAAPTPVLS